MGSSQRDVQVSYDVDNEFFRLWLDERMNYTCGNFDGTDNLEEAQLKKLAFHAQAAHVGPQSTVLDIGCGWGANIEYQALVSKAKEVHGITLSPAQHAEIMRRKIPNVSATVVSYLDYKPQVKFDSIISICMMEHICNPQEGREGKAIEMYRNYFRLAHSWSNPGAHFGLQTILRNRVPRNQKDVRDLGWVTYDIFPGGLAPRLEEIIAAVNPYWEVLEVKTRRLDYQKTTEHWRARLRDHEKLIRGKWGDKLFDDYERYLSTCVRGFEMHYTSLAQYSLKRIDF